MTFRSFRYFAKKYALTGRESGPRRDDEVSEAAFGEPERLRAAE